MPSSRSRRPTADRNLNRLPHLDELLIEFQRTLARVRQETTNISKYDSDFTKGNRALYLIDSLEVELKARLFYEEYEKENNRIKVDLEDTNSQQSIFKFIVEPTILDSPESKLILLSHSPVDPSEFKITLIDKIVSNQDVIIRFVKSGSVDEVFNVSAKTDNLGNVRFWVDTTKAIIKVQGQEEPIKLKHAANDVSEWFVQAIFKSANVGHEITSDFKQLNIES